MSNGNGSPTGAALESVTRLAAHRDPGDPLVEALQSIASELRDLRVEVAQLQTQVKRETQHVRDDLRVLTEKTRQVPVIRDMLVEVLTRVPEK